MASCQGTGPPRAGLLTDRRARLVAGVAGVALALLLAPAQPLPLPIEMRWLAAYLLFVVLPGWLLVRLLLPALPCRRLEIALLSLAAGYALAILLGLALHALFQPIVPWQIAAGGGLVVAALALAGRRDLTPPAPLSGAERGETGVGGWYLFFCILVVAAALRLLDLGWSEFQGDEARVVLRAMAALQGADGALAAHRKVPGEILLTYLFAGSLGQIVEHVARLPFALAGVGAVLAFYTLARGLLGRPAGLVAGLLLAVNGYFVAFGRILQYDSLSFFLGIAGLICCWRFGQTGASADAVEGVPTLPAESTLPARPSPPGSPVAWALLGALLLSGAALVALGAIFLVLPALLLAWPGLRAHARSWRVLLAWSWPILPVILAAALVLGASDPTDGPGGIWSYLGPRLGGNRPYWHLALFLQSANHYLSTPYLAVMLGAGVVGCLLGLIHVVRSLSGRAIVIRLVLALLLAAVSWSNPRVALALGALLALGLVLQAPGPDPRHWPHWSGMRVALAWAAGPLFVHLLLIRVPGTHWREAFPGLILVLAALCVPLLAHPRARIMTVALLAVLIAGAGHFSWVTLVQRLPEYQLAYPTIRHPLDWTDRDGRGVGGIFGTVHRHGWKALGVLDAEGALPGGFATNESPAIAAWYLRRPQGCAGALTYVFRVERTPHDRNLAVPVPLPSGYQNRGQVREQGRPTIAILMPPASQEQLGQIPAEAYVERFDRDLASAWRPVGELYRADLGAAAARRACANLNEPPAGSPTGG